MQEESERELDFVRTKWLSDYIINVNQTTKRMLTQIHLYLIYTVSTIQCYFTLIIIFLYRNIQ